MELLLLCLLLLHQGYPSLLLLQLLLQSQSVCKLLFLLLLQKGTCPGTGAERGTPAQAEHQASADPQLFPKDLQKVTSKQHFLEGNFSLQGTDPEPAGPRAGHCFTLPLPWREVDLLCPVSKVTLIQS